MANYDLTCPHDDCAEVLAVSWHLSYTLGPDDTTAPVQSEAHCETWQIECMAGHVILLPDRVRCCDDPEGPDCTHNPDDYDWSDETSILRDRDMLRLRAVIDRLEAVAS
jgi:hypothetical protein